MSKPYHDGHEEFTVYVLLGVFVLAIALGMAWVASPVAEVAETSGAAGRSAPVTSRPAAWGGSGGGVLREGGR